MCRIRAIFTYLRSQCTTDGGLPPTHKQRRGLRRQVERIRTPQRHAAHRVITLEESHGVIIYRRNTT